VNSGRSLIRTRGIAHSNAHWAESTSACSNTVLVAFSCLSGG
jgi:hypothetical protein